MDRLYAGTRSFRRLRRGPDATGLTEFTSSMASITDTALKEVMDIGNDFIGGWIRLKYVDDNSATQERVARVTQFDRSAGTVTFSPAIGNVHGTAATVNGEYELWPDVHPDEADNAINRVLNEMPYDAHLPVTLVTDGDMEDTGTTNWTAVATATLSKVASPLAYGRQALRVVTAALGDGVRCAVVSALPNERFYLSVGIVMSTTDDWTFSLERGAGLETLESVTIGELPELEVRFNVAANSSTSSVAFQAVSTTAGAETIDIGWVSLLSDRRYHYPVDSSSVDFGDDVFNVLRLPQGYPSDTNFVYSPLYHELVPVEFTASERSRDGNPITIWTPRVADPLFIRSKRRFPSITTDAATTTADKEAVVNGVLHYLEKARGNPAEANRYWRKYRLLTSPDWDKSGSESPRIAVS